MERFLQLKKLARLQMLREEKILADVIYKCSNQLRQWAGLRRLRWVAKQARIAAFRGKRLSPASVRAVLDTVELQGLEIKRHMADSYLLPVMGILLALLAYARPHAGASTSCSARRRCAKNLARKAPPKQAWIARRSRR